MSSRRIVIPGLALVAALLGVPGGAAPEELPDVGLVETVDRRLVLLDVSVAGPGERIRGLAAGDFEVVIDGRRVDELLVDPLCGEARRPAAPAAGPVPAPQPDSATPAHYLFYFDQHHLTIAGRRRSIEVARELVRELLDGSSRGMIVSAGQRMRTFAGWTDDPEPLLQALDRLERDGEQWETFATGEDRRIEEILATLETGSMMGLDAGRRLSAEARAMKQTADAGESAGAPADQVARVRAQGQALQDSVGPLRQSALLQARSVARVHQQEERSRTNAALRQFAAALARMAELRPPKAVVYFADTLRSDAGDHYLLLFRDAWATVAGGHLETYDGVIHEAAANGIRLYTVEAQGLRSSYTPFAGVSMIQSLVASSPQVLTERFRQAQDGLAGLALETGGEAFLNGVPASRIAERLDSDKRCLYLIGFDPAGLPEDKPLPVRVSVARAGIEVRARGTLIVQSPSARLTSRLTAAFSAPDEVGAAHRAGGAVIPTGFTDGKYTALVQAFAPGSVVDGATWDLGVSVVTGGRVPRDAAGRVTLGTGGVPVVLETEMRFAPGGYTLVAVAHDSTTGEISTGQREGRWPDPSAAPATIGPIVAVQPVEAVFLRDGVVRRRGSLGREVVRVDAPAALVGIVCGPKKRAAPLRIERRLVGESAAPFEPIRLDAQERCAVFSDVVRAGTMTPGSFRYEVRVLQDGEPLDAAEHEFLALDPGAARVSDPR